MIKLANKTLSSASKKKNDEFYTRLEDIEREMKHYWKHFDNKHIFCNCDDPEISNFWRYFAMHFQHLNIKQLTATHYNYDGSPSYRLDMYKEVPESEKNKQTFLTMESQDIDLPLGYITPLKENGDFRSSESIKILKESDIVITNPPFSLFREYVEQLMNYHKKFIIIGSSNSIAYKDIFPLLKDNKMWLGEPFQSGNAYFNVPKDSDIDYAKGVYDQQTNLVKFRNISWFTNIDLPKRHDEIITFKKYNSDDYPKYDNYDAIEVSKIKDIPADYYEPMGVPITFMNSYNPDQFKILGLAPERAEKGKSVLQIKRYKDATQHNKNGTIERGSKVNDGPVIARDEPLKNHVYYTSPSVPNKYLQVLYARVIIQRKRKSEN